MGMHWGAESLQALLPPSKWARLQSVQVDPSTPTPDTDAINFLNGQTGDLMTSIPANKFYRLRRRKLRSLLAEDLTIRYSHKIESITYSPDGKHAIAHFTNNNTIKASLIVGADGARSAVRSHLLGPELGSVRTLPYSATFVQARYSAEQALFLRKFHPLYLASINPANLFAFFGLHDIPDPAKPETWTFFFYISWPCSLEEQAQTAHWTDAQRLQQGKDFSKHFTEPWKSAYEWLPDDQKVWYMNLTDFDPGAEGHRWDTHDGRVTLAGDAAHAMTYQRGQGLNHSITDAGRLAAAVQDFVTGKKRRADAVAQYEEEMIARGGGEVRMSSTNTEMVHDWSKVQESPIMKSGMTKVQDIKKQQA